MSSSVLADWRGVIAVRQERMDPFSDEFKAEFVKNQQDLFSDQLHRHLSVCDICTVNLKQIIPILFSATGIDAFSDTNELLRIGERINNLTRVFNLREGLIRAMDTLPKRLLSEPLPDGPGQGGVAQLKSFSTSTTWYAAGTQRGNRPKRNSESLESKGVEYVQARRCICRHANSVHEGGRCE